MIKKTPEPDSTAIALNKSIFDLCKLILLKRFHYNNNNASFTSPYYIKNSEFPS